MKSEHVLKIRFSPPGSGTWDFTVRAVVDKCITDCCGAHGLRLVGCVPVLPEIIEKHCFQHKLLNNLMCAVLKRLEQEYARGWNPDFGFDFTRKRTSRPKNHKPTPVDTDQLVRKAAKFAETAHYEAGNVRKYTGEGYIQHPAAVVELIKTVPHTPEMLQAAWLHDVLEDAKVTLKQIKDTFGEKVFALVWQLTDRMALADGNRKLRKAVERLRYSYVSNEAKTIKLADLIDNARSIIAHDPDFAKVYMKEMRDLLTVLREGDSSLWLKATNICDTYDRGLYTKPEPVNAEARRPLFASAEMRAGILRGFDGKAIDVTSRDSATPLFSSIKTEQEAFNILHGYDRAMPRTEKTKLYFRSNGDKIESVEISNFEIKDKKIWSARLLELSPGKNIDGQETAIIKVRISPIEVTRGLPSDKRLFVISNFTGELHSTEMALNLSNAIRTATEFWLDEGKSLYLDRLDYTSEGDGEHIVKLEYRIVHK